MYRTGVVERLRGGIMETREVGRKGGVSGKEERRKEGNGEVEERRGGGGAGRGKDTRRRLGPPR